jgi:hypothetical protein
VVSKKTLAELEDRFELTPLPDTAGLCQVHAA